MLVNFFFIFHSCTLFMLHLFACRFMLLSLHVAFFCVALISCLNLSVFHLFIWYSFQIVLFSCCILSMLHLFVCCTLLKLYLFSCCFMLRSLHVAPFFLLQFFHIALFSSFTFFVLFSFRVAVFIVALFSFCTLFE